MKILLNRFCPKGLPLEQITYEALLEKFTKKPGYKTPTEKQLEASDIGILYQHCDDNGRFYILENGLILYRYKKMKEINGCDKLVDRSTVISTDKSKISYSYCTGEKFTIPKEVYKDLPFFKVLQIFATIRIEHNISSLEDTRALYALNKAKKERFLASTDLDEFVQVEMSIDYQQVRDAIESLTDEQKEAIYLCDYENLTQEKAAELIGITRSSVQSRLKGAYSNLEKRKNLKELL